MWLSGLSVATIAAACLTASPASAHILKTDGSIAAVLHIDPDDQPASGTSTPYYLFIDDTTNRFTFAGCDCIVTVKKGSRVIVTEPLRLDTQSVPSGTVTFPEPGAYDLVVSGAPRVSGAFQPFTFDYLVRVTAGSSAALAAGSIIWLGACLGVSIVALTACWLQLKRQGG